MTLSTTSSRVVHLGNGAARSFPYGFRIPAATDVYVVLTSPDGGLTTLTTSQYSISGLGTGGGEVTYPVDVLAAPLPNGWSLTIERVLALTQPLDLPAQGAYSAEAVEGALDRVVMQLQQIADGSASGGSPLTGPISWDEVQDKPTTFPPAAHTHAIATGTTAGFLSAADKTKLDGLGAAPVTTVNGHTGTVVLTAADVSAIATTARGAASGVASLGADGLVPTAQLPAAHLASTFVVASQAAMLALSSAVKGDFAVRTDTSTTYVLSATPPATLANWVLMPSAGAVSSVNGLSGVVALTQGLLGGIPSIKDYGAVCDGSTDDTTAWNTAIAAINAGTISALMVPGLSKITAALTTVTKGFALIGNGTRKSGVLATAGGDVTFLNVAPTSYQEKVQIRDFSFLTTLANSGQALKIAYSPSNAFSAYSTVHMSNVEFAGQTNLGSQGWNRGYELVNVSNAAFDHVSFYGYYNSGESQPAGWLHSAWGCKVTATTDHNSYALYWRACEIYYADRAHWSPSGNLQGLCWTDCAYAFTNTGWELTPDGDTLLPYFAWVNCQWEGYLRGIKLDNAAYVSIDGSQFFVDATVNTARKAIYVSNSYGVTVRNCEFVNGDGGVGALGSSDLIVFDSVNGGLTTGNNLRGAKGKLVWFTGDSQFCHSVEDRVSYPAATGVPYKNDSTLAATNSRRGMRLDEGVSAAQGAQSGQASFPSSTSIPSTSGALIPCSVSFPVEIGDKLRVSVWAYTTINAGNETQVTARVREYNHRPGSGSPFQVLRSVVDRNNWADAKPVGATKPEAYFTDQFEFDVIAAASDARIDLDLWTLSGLATLGYAQMKVERL